MVSSSQFSEDSAPGVPSDDILAGFFHDLIGKARFRAGIHSQCRRLGVRDKRASSIQTKILYPANLTRNLLGKRAQGTAPTVP